MARYAICYDLDTKLMEQDGLTDSNKTQVYEQGKRVLSNNGFTHHMQRSMYGTADADDSFERVVGLPMALRENAPDFCHYLNRFEVVRILESANILNVIRPPAVDE